MNGTFQLFNEMKIQIHALTFLYISPHLYCECSYDSYLELVFIIL